MTIVRLPKNLDSKQVHAAYVAHNRNARATARALGVDASTVTNHVQKIEAAPTHSKSTLDDAPMLRAQVKALQSQLLSDARVEREIMKAASARVTVPDWVSLPPSKPHETAGVPTLFASDWHWSEVVRPAEIGGVNEYNLKIAHERARTFVTVAIDLLRNHIKGGKYPGIVLILGGDMMSGDIHEELQQTNEIETMPAMLNLLGVLTWCIESLQAEFGKVFIPCVTGNHGRTSRKPRAKRRNHTNYDWLLYQLLAARFDSNKNITFLIPEGADAYYKVYQTRYLLTHGDQFRGGDGMIGALGPISRGDKKKRSRNVQTDRSFDVMLLGHWHQYIHLGRFIVNGTLKGYDEYADQNNFDVEPAQQAMWITHPTRGITFRMPIFVDRAKQEAKTEWVSVTR